MKHRQLRSLGSVIRGRRKELGLTQEELAERISALDEYVRQSDISRIERGEITLPRRARLERIATALDLPLGELLALSGWAGADTHFADSAGWSQPPERVVSLVGDTLFAPRESALHVAKLGVTIDRFQDLTISLQQRARELAAAREALSQTRRMLPRYREASEELDVSA